MKLDLSKFKKIECDDKCTTLEHPGGHSIKIAHKGLSDEARQQLEEMPVHKAKGGYAKFAQKFDPSMAKNSKPSAPEKAIIGQTNMAPKPASHAYTEPQDQGTDVVLAALNKKAPPFGPLGTEEKQHYPPCINPSCKSYGRSHPNCRCYGGVSEHTGAGEAGHFADGGEVDKEYYCDANRTHRKGCEYFKDGGEAGSEGEKLEKVAQEVNANLQTPPPQSVAQAPQAPVDPTNQSYGAETVPPPSPSPQPEQADLNPNPEVAGGAEEPEAAPDRAPASAPVVTNPDKVAQEPSPEPTPHEKLQADKARILNNIVPETQAFAADLDNGHIKPKTYHDLFNDKGTLGKIGTIFGLLVGGMGAGLSHQPNMLMEMMNKEIERDLDAQKQSSANKQNFLKINQSARTAGAESHLTEAEANLKDLAKSRIQMNMAALHHLVDINSKLPPGSPQYNQGQQVLAMLNQGVQNENFNISDRAATAAALANYMGGAQQGGAGPNTTVMKSGLLGPEAKEMGADVENKTIPGVPGRASRPIEENDRKQVQAMGVLSDKANDLLKFAKAHKGTISPAQRAVGAQKAEEMINFYNQSIQGGILTQGRLEWLDKQIKKNPTSIFQDVLGNNSRLNEIKQSNDHRRDLLLKNYGFQVPKASAPSAAPSGGEDQVKVVNGVKYRRGPNGEAIKVQ